ncbi:LPS export ABC transporter periplasmic protein LptC [Candidatus Pelagibacter sp.]|nr:LPS export ABC transporter periplasmic protein LptC [Candidatus Pelagibacter sp.]
MQKKKLLQLFLIFLVIIFPVFVYFTYFHSSEVVNSLDKKDVIKYEDDKDIALKEIEKKDISSNLIENLRYISKDSQNNEYEIISKYGKISNENQDIILMTEVKAKITMVGSNPIFISAGFAKYNAQNYETNFSDNVVLNYTDHKINSDNLELLFEKNLATIYSNIVYTNNKTIILADKLEFDMLSKNSKIFMNEKNKKIKITSIQPNGNN